MTSPVNQASEDNRRKWQSQVEFETMMQRLRQAEHYPPPAAPRRRATSWADVRAGLGMLLILAAGAGVVYLFIEWQALGGPWH